MGWPVLDTGNARMVRAGAPKITATSPVTCPSRVVVGALMDYMVVPVSWNALVEVAFRAMAMDSARMAPTAAACVRALRDTVVRFATCPALRAS